MRTEQEPCEECQEVTPHGVFGMVPEYALIDHQTVRDSRTWVYAYVCTNCGTVARKKITDDDVDRFDKRYLGFLSEHGIISEEEADEMLKGV